ncbi:MAG: transcriptional regulator with XRE-family HTH domain [Halieaceae bacterium]|jgi:transcriptional regulator with XRE-family HTH domain
MIEQEKINLLISKKIRELRIESGDSLQKMGDLLNVSNQQYSKIELGKTRIFAAQLAVLADYYSIDVLFFYSE